MRKDEENVMYGGERWERCNEEREAGESNETWWKISRATRLSLLMDRKEMH